MPGDAPPRTHPIVNPEHAIDLLRRLVRAWDAEDQTVFLAALADARSLVKAH